MKVTPENATLADMLTVGGLIQQIVECAACKAKNRIKAKQLDGNRIPRCGKCGLPFERFRK